MKYFSTKWDWLWYWLDEWSKRQIIHLAFVWRTSVEVVNPGREYSNSFHKIKGIWEICWNRLNGCLDFLVIEVIENIEDIVLNTVEINEDRNDSLIIKSYRFTNLPFLTRAYKWAHWQKLYLLLVLGLIGYILNRLYEKYKKHKLNQGKIDLLKKQKEEKLAKIYEEEEQKAFIQIKKEIVEEAQNETSSFTLKLEKWLELLQTSPQFEENPKLAYEKIAVVILFVDFEYPGLSSKMIKLFRSGHIKDTIDTIENISKVGIDKTRANLVEFHENFMSPENLFGGKTTSSHIIDTAFTEKEKRSIFNIDSEEPFGFIDHVSISVYPTPDATNASKDMHFYYIKRIQDAGDYTNATDVPFRFVPCMVAGLAFYLAQKYQPQLVQQMKLYYEDELARALAEDGSASSTYITPKAYYPGT